MCSLCIVLVAFLGFGPDRGTCYPQGPPPSTCVTMFPKHGVERQSSQPPYTITLSKATYTPGETITVSVQGQGSQAFSGFQVTAHRVASSGNAEEFIGTFTPSDSSTQVIACLGQPGKMWAHNDNKDKTSITATWTAPSSSVGNVQFFLTVVERKLTFWHKISTTLQAAPGAVVEPNNKVPQVNVPSILVVNWTACGETKGCWLVPETGQDSCKGSDCLAALAYEKRGNNLFFLEMAVKGHGNYISVGFSEDKMMGDDQTITCTANPDHESIQVGYNPMKYNDRQYTVGLSNLIAGQLDGQTYCRFTRQAAISSITGKGNKTFDLNNEFYLFLAWGHVYEGTDVIGKHQDAPAISSNKIDLTVVQPTSAAPTTPVSNVFCFIFVTASLLLKTW